MKHFQCRLLPLVVELPGWWFEGPPCSIWGEGGDVDSANWSRVALISPEVECSLVMNRVCKWSEGEIESGLWKQNFGLSIFPSFLNIFGFHICFNSRSQKWVYDYEDILRISSLCAQLKTFILATTKNQPSNEARKKSLVSVFCFRSFHVGGRVLKILRFSHFKLALMALCSQVVKIKHCQRHYGPRRRLLYRVIWFGSVDLVW